MHKLVVISLSFLLASGARVVPREENHMAPFDGTGKVSPRWANGIPEKVGLAFQAIQQPMVIGQVNEPSGAGRLIPSLVPPPGLEYRFKVRAHGLQRQWLLDEISELGASTWKNPTAIADVTMKWQSYAYGHKSQHVLSNATGKEIFKIRNSKGAFNLFTRRQSWRILPAFSKDNADALFTINGESMFMRVDLVLGLADYAFRVYRGRERDNKLAFYVEGRFPKNFIPGTAAGSGGTGLGSGSGFTFYESESKSKVLAKIEQNPNYGSWDYLNRINDEHKPLDQYLFTVTVQPGVDSAVILACASIFDMIRQTD